jgi:cell wall-associated NlpC family hydrolase
VRSQVANRRRRPRAVRFAAVLITTTSLLLTGADFAGSALASQPPPNPSSGQLNAARSAKDALASQVGALSGKIAQAQIQLQQLQARTEYAEQKYADAITKLQQANQAAARAKAAVRAAADQVVQAHARFVDYIQASYMSGDVQGTAGTLLTAPDPSAVLEQADLQQYQQQHQVDAIGALQTATVNKSNADARARQAVLVSKQAAAQAQAQRIAAHNAYNAEQAQAAELQRTMASTQAQLNAAQDRLATLNHEHAQYLAYQAEQARLARIRRQQELERERRLRQQQQQQGGGGGGGGVVGGGGGGGSWSNCPAAPSGGGWNAGKGQEAARRALCQLGMPYIWAGGNQWGPTTGGCTDPIAPCGTLGYDCSGLVLFGWGQPWDHFAATQYWQAGSYHPSPGNFMPGDLLFWGNPISHVAIYIGGGYVVQAPESGDVVKTTPWDQVESGYYGATRPLT